MTRPPEFGRPFLFTRGDRPYNGCMANTADYPIRSKQGEPVWELATHYPPQGRWTKDQYLIYTEGRRGIEFNTGTLEFLPMPTEYHQQIIRRLVVLLLAHVEPKALGEVLFAGLRVETQPDKVREPDVVFMAREHAGRRTDELWHGADLVMEVVSESPADVRRDYVEKRAEYEAAGISEYWIVDPKDKRITVLALNDGKYVEHCVAGDGEVATSALLPGFQVEAAKVFHRE